MSKHLLSTSLGLSLAFSAAAQAETQNPAKDEIETIVITGERLTRNLQDTLTSVQVYQADDFAKLNAINAVDVLNRTANVVADEDFFSIRGIRNSGVTGSDGSSDAATVFVDNVALGSRSVSRNALSIWDIASIEILRGAQSTNQGPNTLAGAVVIRSQDPEFESSGKARFRVGDYGAYEASFAQGGALVDDYLAYRIAIQHQYTDGYLHNTTLNDKHWDSNKELNGRLKLLFQPTGNEDTQALLTLARQSAEVPTSSNRGISPIGGDPFHRENDYNLPWHVDDNRNDQASLDIKHSIDDQWSVQSITTLSDYLLRNRFDDDRTTNHPSGLNSTRNQLNDRDSRSQELRLKFEGDALQAVMGIYLAETESQNANQVDARATDLDGPGPFPAVIFSYDTNYQQEDKNQSIYFDADYDLNDWLTLNFGGRLDKTEIRYSSTVDASRVNSINPAFDPTCTALAPNYGSNATSCNALADHIIALGTGTGSGDAEKTVFLPKLGAMAELNDNIKLGASYQRAFRSAGASLNVAQSSVIPFDPEYSDNFELSLRSQWLDNSLTLNASLFYIDWTDQQVNVRNPSNVYDTFTANAGKSVLQGLEIDVAWDINSNWEVFAAAGYVDTEFKQFDSIPNYNTEDVKGNKFPYASEVTASFGINWENEAGYFASLSGRYTSEYYRTIDNDPEEVTKPYSLFDTRFGYQRDNWSLSAYVKNLGDKEYFSYTYKDTLLGKQYYTLAAPRTAGVMLEVNW